MFDLIIRSGQVVDGTGEAPRTADIAITDGRIAAVGRVDGTASRVIDADGAMVAPGWVDVHTHYDGQVTWDPTLSPSSWHGVTTAVMGNCGVGFAPVRPGQHDFLIELMEGVEDIPGTALAEGIDWRWEHFEEYLDTLDTCDLALDVGTQVPHGAVRAYVMGKRASTDERPEPEELAAMAEIVRRGMAAGALGFSTSRTLLHRDVHGVHMPGTFAGAEELLGIAEAMATIDHGVFQIVSDHLGEEQEWDWIREVARRTGRPVTLVSTSAAGYEDGQALAWTREAERDGLRILPQIAGRPTGVLHGLQSSTNLFVQHPTYLAELAGLDHPARVERMRDPEVRTRLLAETSRSAMLAQYGEQLLWMLFPLGDMPDYEPTRDASVGAIAAAQGRSGAEVMYDLLVADGGNELFYQPLGLYGSYDFGFFEQTIPHREMLFGLSDGGAHCGVIADAGMPTFILTHWGRDRSRGERIPVELLVSKLTRDTARAYGLDDRGTLEVGALADVNVIDFEALRLHRPTARHDLPAGGRRLVQEVDGYQQVIKRGVVIREDNQDTGARPGNLLRGARPAQA